MRYIKGRIYKKTIKFFSRFPLMVRLFYYLYKNAVIYFPYIRASYKWKLIRTGYLDFHIEKSLVEKGKLKEYNKLFDIRYNEGNTIEKAIKLRNIPGEYKLGICPRGLRIKGKVKTLNISFVYLKINGTILRKANLKNLGRFAFTVKTSSLSQFPKQSALIVEQDNGTKLLYGKSDQVLLSVPFGQGTLESIIENGYNLSKKGTIVTSCEVIEMKKEKYLSLYSRIKDVFDHEIGTPLFLTYGTLLGQIREGDFILNDDDFDVGYISLKSNSKQVRKESLEVTLKLLRLGFNVSVNPVGKLFNISDGSGISLDVLPVWFENEWNIAHRGACVKSSVDDYLPARKSLLRGKEVYVPNNPEVFLAGYYGETWRIPDPGYVTNFEQTGKVLLKSYHNYLITPLEFRRISRIIEEEKISNPRIGRFTSRALKGVCKV